MNNALLKINGERARRMFESNARDYLRQGGFGPGSVIRHTIHRDSRETIVTDHYDANGNRARLTVTYSI